MVVREFLDRVEAHPSLELVYSDNLICILRCLGTAGERQVRLGLWVVERMRWEQILDGLGLASHV
jgi:hypothetical protein